MRQQRCYDHWAHQFTPSHSFKHRKRDSVKKTSNFTHKEIRTEDVEKAHPPGSHDPSGPVMWPVSMCASVWVSVCLCVCLNEWMSVFECVCVCERGKKWQLLPFDRLKQVIFSQAPTDFASSNRSLIYHQKSNKIQFPVFKNETSWYFRISWADRVKPSWWTARVRFKCLTVFLGGVKTSDLQLDVQTHERRNAGTDFKPKNK